MTGGSIPSPSRRASTRAIRALMRANPGMAYNVARRLLLLERDDDTVIVQLSPAEEITDPDRAEALGLTVDARRLRERAASND